MNVRDESIRKLITTYERRLQKLLEQKAYLGVRTPPEISMEIEDVQKELQALRSQLDLKIEIRINDNPATFPPEKQMRLKEMLAAEMGVQPNDIGFALIGPGSVIFQIEASFDAIDRLLHAYETDALQLPQIEIISIKILPLAHPEEALESLEKIESKISRLETILDDLEESLSRISPIQTNGKANSPAPSQNGIKIGDTVQLNTGQTARVIGLAELFGQAYADVFIEPDGPTRRELLANLRPLADPLTTLSGGQTLPPPLFMARLLAMQLKTMLTQQGVLSAANFRVTPLPHQVLAVDFVMNLPHPRALIADEVGLGKTIEAALVYEEFKLRGQARRAVIITPAGLTDQWRDELAQKFGENFVIYDRTMLTALREIHGQEANLWTLHDQIITSLDFIKPARLRPELSEPERRRREAHNQRVFQDIIEAGWDVAIFDEAHKLSKQADGSETARYRVGEGLAQAVPIFLLLSATPHQGDAARFLHLLNLVDPYGFNQITDLQPDRISSVVWRTRKRAAVDAQGRRLFKQRLTDIYPVDRSGPDHALERQLYDEVTDYVGENYNRAMGRGDRAFGFLMLLFQRMVTSSSQAIHESLRKRLDKLLAIQTGLGLEAGGPGSRGTGELPLQFDEETTADEDTQTVLDELIATSGVIDEAELRHEIAIIERLLDLARRAKASPDAKMVALLTIIDEVCRREGNPQTKFLIFTEFVATQQAIGETLTNLGYAVELIYGGQKMDERIAARQRFAAAAQFLVSTDAGGEGINLQFCHVMVNYDLPWNPMKLEQRIGRLDRIGQTRDVLVLNLLIQDTAEQRVREVLEAKLDLIRQQYGDDKLADILSTLQDEFHFDRLYMEALLKRQAESAALDRLAEQIFQRAKEILDQDDLLLPQSQAEFEQYRRRLVEVSQEKVKAMLTGYLLAHGQTLNEYTRREGVYYFDLPDGRTDDKTRYAYTVFDRERAVADDGLTYLHLNHPVIQALLTRLADDPAPAVAQLRLSPAALPANVPSPARPLLWAIYRLGMTNHDDVDRQELVSVVIDAAGQRRPRLATLLATLTPDQVEAAFIPEAARLVQDTLALVRQAAEKQAAERFSEIHLAHVEKLTAQREKIERYYKQQEFAVSQIAIDNIRQAKHRELLERRHADLTALDRRQTLVPDLTMVGLAVVAGKR